MSQAVSTSGSLLSVIVNPGSGSPAECGVTYIESLDLANPAVLRELDSGSYVLYGKFKAYSGDNTIIVFESKLNANIVKSTDCSSIMIFNPVNSKVECLTIYDDRYERTDVALQDVVAHIGQLKNDLVELGAHFTQKNILDTEKCSVGQYVDGRILTDSNYTLDNVYTNQGDAYILSDIMKCEYGEKYTFNRQSYPTSRTIYFGDKDKKGVGLAKYDDCVVANADGTWTVTVPQNACYFRWGFVVNTSGWENEGWKTKAMICKGESLSPSFVDNRYFFDGVDVVDMSNRLESIDNDVNAIKSNYIDQSPIPFSEIPTEGNYVLQANVGGNFEKKYNQYRTLYKMKVNKNTGYFVTNIQTLSSDANVWVLTDKDGKAISVGSYGNYNTGAFVKGNENAEYLYFTALNDAIGYVYTDNRKFEVYKGDNVSYTSTANFIHNGNKINDVDIVTVNTSERFDLSFTGLKCNTIGLWLKVPYFELDNLTSIKLEAKKNGSIVKTSTINKTHFEHGNYIFFKMLVCDEIDTISITPNCSSAIDIELSDVIIVNQFTRPYLCINFDNAWQQSEDCGAYDYLINNNIPFTITGSLENVDSNTRQKLSHAHAKGLLDIGCYGNEQYGGVSYSVTNEISDYATLDDTMRDLLTKKLAYCENPISFGPRQHRMTPALRRCIADNGFKISRYSANSMNADIDMYNSLFDKSLIVLTEFGFNNTVKNNLIAGCGMVLFAHGLSLNPSGEEYPSNFSLYKESYMNEILRYRDDFGMMIINMKQLLDLIN